VTTLLGEAGRTFLKVFVASLLIFTPGVLSAPNLNEAFALGVSALCASIAAGIKAIQVLVPALSFRSYVPLPYGPFLDAFIQAFLGAFFTAIIPILNAPDLNTWKSLATGALIGAVNAGIRAIQALLTPGELPAGKVGLRVEHAPAPGENPHLQRSAS
jgi:hypothetical protein